MNKNIRISDLEKELSFFYAVHEADLYDDIARFTQKDYDISHDTLIELIEYHLNDINKPSSILDIGCGTGYEALKILSYFPNSVITAIDFSQEMLDVFKSKTKSKFSNRLNIVCEDIKIINNFKEFNDYKNYDIIVSAYTLHHYDLETKKSIYSRIFDSLKSNGIFMNLDLASHQSYTLSYIAQKQLEDFIKYQFENLPQNIKIILAQKNIQPQSLMNDWLNHVSKINIPQVLDSKIHSSNNETDLLYNIGFNEVGNPYRNFQSSILWAKK